MRAADFLKRIAVDRVAVGIDQSITTLLRA
jgi:hypothetical protein